MQALLNHARNLGRHREASALAMLPGVPILSKGRLAGILDRADMSEDKIPTMAFKEH